MPLCCLDFEKYLTKFNTYLFFMDVTMACFSLRILGKPMSVFYYYHFIIINMLYISSYNCVNVYSFSLYGIFTRFLRVVQLQKYRERHLFYPIRLLSCNLIIIYKATYDRLKVWVIHIPVMLSIPHGQFLWNKISYNTSYSDGSRVREYNGARRQVRSDAIGWGLECMKWDNIILTLPVMVI